MWDLNSLTKDWTHTPCSGTVESRSLDLQGSPNVHVINIQYLLMFFNLR